MSEADMDVVVRACAALNAEGDVRASVAAVAERLGWSPSRARMALSAAEERGILRWSP